MHLLIQDSFMSIRRHVNDYYKHPPVVWYILGLQRIITCVRLHIIHTNYTEVQKKSNGLTPSTSYWDVGFLYSILIYVPLQLSSNYIHRMYSNNYITLANDKHFGLVHISYSRLEEETTMHKKKKSTQNRPSHHHFCDLSIAHAFKTWNTQILYKKL